MDAAFRPFQAGENPDRLRDQNVLSGLPQGIEVVEDRQLRVFSSGGAQRLRPLGGVLEDAGGELLLGSL